MLIHKFTVGPFAENTYLLIREQKALIVDPGFSNTEEYQRLTVKLQEQDVKLTGVILTHAHVDHVLGLSLVLNEFDVPVYLSDRDRYLWNNFASQAAMFGLQADDFSFQPESLPVKKEFEIAPFVFDVLHTPGHAPEHVSLYFPKEQILLAGDALFREGIGRTDLYKGDMNLLKSSITGQLYALPDETVVYPGHGPKTTIGHEKKSNPFVTLDAPT